VTAQQINNNLDTVVDMREQLPLDLMQIDDGFEIYAGDWYPYKLSFPKGVGELADSIQEKGLFPGIWLAPFIVHPKADLAKNIQNFCYAICMESRSMLVLYRMPGRRR
jgi:alpha-galactosidase